jgi:hypothetical protein
MPIQLRYKSKKKSPEMTDEDTENWFQQDKSDFGYHT